jgi:hypothetical protein
VTAKKIKYFLINFLVTFVTLLKKKTIFLPDVDPLKNVQKNQTNQKSNGLSLRSLGGENIPPHIRGSKQLTGNPSARAASSGLWLLIVNCACIDMVSGNRCTNIILQFYKSVKMYVLFPKQSYYIIWRNNNFVCVP